MARARLVFLAALTVLCLWAGVGASQGLAAYSGSHRVRGHHVTRCSGNLKLHSGGAYVLRRGHLVHLVRCRRHRAHKGPLSPRGRHGGARRPSGQRRLKRRTSAAGASQCPDASLVPSDANLQRIRDAVLCLVNRERLAHGEKALQANARLEQAAQSHTESMAAGNYFEHDGPGGDTPANRMRAVGYIYSSRVGYQVAENLAWGTLWLASPRAIVASWMGSPGHRANMLDPQLRDSGIGVSPHLPGSLAKGQSGGIYTQDFGVIITG